MILVLAHAATALPAGFTFDPDAALSRLQGVALGAVVLALFVVTMIALFGPARQGNLKKSTNISVAVIIALIPLAIAGIGVVVFAGSFLGWFG